MGVKRGLNIHQKQSAQKNIWTWKGRSENFWILHKKICLFLCLWLNSSQYLPLSSHNSGTTPKCSQLKKLFSPKRGKFLSRVRKIPQMYQTRGSLISARIPHLIAFIYLLAIRKNVIYKLNWWLYKVRHDTMYFNDAVGYSPSDVTSGALQV